MQNTSPASPAAPEHKTYYLCVDCGGSKTAVTLTDGSTGDICARVTGGPSNFSYLGLDGFLNEVSSCIEKALHNARGIDKEVSLLPSVDSNKKYFAAAWFGVSGVDTPEAVGEIIPRLSALLSLPPARPYLTLANDTTLLAAPLVAAAKHNPSLRTCVAVVGGTGSIAASFRLTPTTSNSEPGPDAIPQEIARVGGWGWILGDEGGGFHIGREAIRHLLRQHELAVLSGTPLTPPSDTDESDDLRTRVLALFGVKSAPELLAIIHDADPPSTAVLNHANIHVPPGSVLSMYRTIAREKRLSQLAPLVIRAAFGDGTAKSSGGDPLALGVLKATSAELASQIAILLEGPSGPDPACPNAIPAKSSLLIFGGSLVGIPKYRDFVLEALRLQGHEFTAVEHVSNAAETGGRVLHELFNSSK
ncbi:uncharacterized protein FOMMEDRAFT_131181 [Fomitiporia mediterranea MF3/22]|uniref:uncharacterized protein n=1 Tax=Fomitiporia mediterranea (strain MF3/22) TaxID=694068 RepID=UPI0004409792|nr:uncharacterized protein FOMMEDRAFT_131181 [Fomitiporia mediterranea MF3/22]EJD08398.1 hypothetical protein FOMMEDRAFT_131181 [Fomitiporia mediterranea MF3/22]